MEFEICANFNLSIITHFNVDRLRDQHKSPHFRSNKALSDVYCFSKFFRTKKLTDSLQHSQSPEDLVTKVKNIF
jgi:hypothetical protein